MDFQELYSFGVMILFLWHHERTSFLSFQQIIHKNLTLEVTSYQVSAWKAWFEAQRYWIEINHLGTHVSTLRQSVVKAFQILREQSSLPETSRSGFARKSTFVTSDLWPTYTRWAMESSVDHNFIVESAEPLRKK